MNVTASLLKKSYGTAFSKFLDGDFVNKVWPCSLAHEGEFMTLNLNYHVPICAQRKPDGRSLARTVQSPLLG